MLPLNVKVNLAKARQNPASSVCVFVTGGHPTVWLPHKRATGSAGLAMDHGCSGNNAIPVPSDVVGVVVSSLTKHLGNPAAIPGFGIQAVRIHA